MQEPLFTFNRVVDQPVMKSLVPTSVANSTFLLPLDNFGTSSTGPDSGLKVGNKIFISGKLVSVDRR